MISHQHKCIFIHIPKTAGTTVEKTITGIDWHTYNHGIEKHCTLNELRCFPYMYNCSTDEVLDTVYPKYCGRPESDIHEIVKSHKQMWPTEALEQYFKFTFVRNPFEWVSSVFYWSGVLREKYNNDLNFYIQQHIAYNKEDFRFKSQYRYTPGMDFIGRFESFEKDFKTVLDHLNITNYTIPHANSNDKKPKIPYQEIYDKKSMDIVYNKYLIDFKKFNYEYDQ